MDFTQKCCFGSSKVTGSQGLWDRETFTSFLVLIWSRLELMKNHCTLATVCCLGKINLFQSSEPDSLLFDLQSSKPRLDCLIEVYKSCQEILEQRKTAPQSSEIKQLKKRQQTFSRNQRMEKQAKVLHEQNFLGSYRKSFFLPLQKRIMGKQGKRKQENASIFYSFMHLKIMLIL